jgi:hypothetical protein
MLLAVAALVLVALALGASRVQAGTAPAGLAPAADATPAPADYSGPTKCMRCHAEEAQAWKDAPHANANKVEAFLAAWEAARSPGYCLECHTTGYDPNSGEYAFEGVTCESCHGPMVEGHPDEKTMPINTAAEACGECHVSTLAEWQNSEHGTQGVSCTSCHDVHGATIKVGEAIQLCERCHVDQVNMFSHAGEAEGGPDCADCHIGPLTGDPSEGHGSTGHNFSVAITACTRCHSSEELHRIGASEPPAEPQPTPTAPPAGTSGTGGTGANAPGTALPVVAGGTAVLVLGLVLSAWRGRSHRLPA